jgi:hypothetical protein
MNLYDFRKALKVRISRWQYTAQAKEDVSDTAALQVLRDFGFQG